MFHNFIFIFFSELNLEIPEEKVSNIANNASTKLNATLLELRRLFLVENMLDSIKFGLSLWVLTYIGSWFNAMTLVLMSWVGLFTIPKVSYFNRINLFVCMSLRMYISIALWETDLIYTRYEK